MKKKISIIENKIIELKKFNGSVIFVFKDYHVRFTKVFGGKIFYCEFTSQNFSVPISQKQIDSLKNLKFKVRNRDFLKNYNTVKIEIILDDLKYVFSEIFKEEFSREMTLQNYIENSTNQIIPKNIKSQKIKVTDDKSSNNAILIVGAIITVILIFSFISQFSVKNSDDNSMSTSKLSDLSGHEIHSFIISKKFILNELISPKSAEFGYYDDMKVSYDGKSTYQIRNFVDCQNFYGALIRHKYDITIDFKGGMWEDPNNWEVLNLKIR